MKSDKVKLGELYEKWQKKTNKSIGRQGVFDDVVDDTGGEITPNAPSNKGKKGSGKKTGAKTTGVDEKKTATAIRKEREKNEDMKLKNMKKGDRRKLERKQRSEQQAEELLKGKKGPGKKGPVTRWAGSKKKRIGKQGKTKQTFKGRH